MTRTRALAVAACFLAACGEGGRPGPKTTSASSKIVVGESMALVSAEVSAAGGVVEVKRPGDPLDGLRIEVAPGSYAEARAFRVSAAPVRSHAFGERFTPRSPVLTVENGGGFAKEPMTLRIPISVPAGHFATGFLYDEAKGTLEGLALVGSDATSVTVATSHFSKVVVGSVAEVLLSGAKTIPTGFAPGVDDWQFENTKTQVADQGMCAGMSLGAMWYFGEVKARGESPLHGRHDNDGVRRTPKLWQDDADALRLCSVLQADHWEGPVARIFRFAPLAPPVVWNLVRWNMLLSGTPQLVVVGRINERGEPRRHAIVGYKIEAEQIFVADPDIPGDDRRSIPYEDGSFRPYKFGADPGIPYPSIGWLPKSSLLDYESIRRAYADMTAKKVGKGRFFEWDLRARVQNKDVPFVDGLTLAGGRLTLHAATKDGAHEAPCLVFREDQTEVEAQDDGSFLLPPGRQRVGVCIGNDSTTWQDFRWVDVTVTVDPRDTFTGVWQRHEVVRDGVYRVQMTQSGAAVQGKAEYPAPIVDDAGNVIVPAGTHELSGTVEDRTLAFKMLGHSGKMTLGRGGMTIYGSLTVKGGRLLGYPMDLMRR